MRYFRRSIAVAACLLASCSGPDSIGNKSEWSALQGVEYEYRSMSRSAPLVLTVSDYQMVGLPATSRSGLVWVLLNPKNEPLYKQLPQGPYHLSASQLAALNVTEPAVLAGLRAHVRK